MMNIHSSEKKPQIKQTDRIEFRFFVRYILLRVSDLLLWNLLYVID